MQSDQSNNLNRTKSNSINIPGRVPDEDGSGDSLRLQYFDEVRRGKVRDDFQTWLLQKDPTACISSSVPRCRHASTPSYSKPSAGNGSPSHFFKSSPLARSAPADIPTIHGFNKSE